MVCRLNTPAVLATLDEARGIVEYFKHSPAATSELNDVARSLEVKPRALKQDNSTHWSSTYNVCTTLQHMKPALQVCGQFSCGQVLAGVVVAAAVDAFVVFVIVAAVADLVVAVDAFVAAIGVFVVVVAIVGAAVVVVVTVVVLLILSWLGCCY